MKTLEMFRAFRLKAAALAAVAWIALAGAGTARAEVIDCTYDGYVYGGGGSINTTNNYVLPTPLSEPVYGFWGFAFLKFDTAALPTSPVASAVLTLDVKELWHPNALIPLVPPPPEGAVGEVSVFAVSADVAGITNKTTATAFRENNIAAVATDSASFAGVGLITLDVTDIVNEWLLSGDNFGLILATPGLDVWMPKIHSLEAIEGEGLAPFITTTAVPEPATMGLLAAGAVGLLARRKRRRNGCSDMHR